VDERMSANQTMTGELPSEPVAARRLKTTRVPDDAHAHVYDGWNRRLAGYVDATVLPHADDDSQTGDRGKSGSGLEQRPAGVVRDVGGVAVHAGGAGGSGGLQSWGAWMAAQHAANLRFLRGLGGGSFRASGGVGTLATAGAAALSGARSSLSAGWSSAAGLAGLFGNAVFSVSRNPQVQDLLDSGAIHEVTDYRAGVLSRPHTHHIASNKDASFRRKFQQLFQGAGMTLEHHLNKIPVIGHQGPHGVAYNLAIFDRLSTAVAPYTHGTTMYKWALRSELKRLAREINTPGSDLNLLVRFAG
jgi:hypothetical protein